MSSGQQTGTQTPSPSTDIAGCAVVDLSHFGLIQVAGEESRTFLQGQLTNDIKAVTPERIQFSSYCSPKGRMLGSFWIFQRGDTLYLQLPAERLEAIRKRLQMFVLRAQVTLADASDDLVRFGIAGDCAAALLPAVPTDEYASLTDGELTVIRLPGSHPRYELVGPATVVQPIVDQALQTGEQRDADFWALLDIRAGIPAVFESTVEAFVPQMANLQLIDGVSFTKGCYTGQEVVARMQYLGKLKRRMYRARVDSAEKPEPGTELFSATSESGQGTGRIVDAAASPDGGYEVLAVLQISSAEEGDVSLGGPDGPRLEFLDMPYSFEAGAD